MGDDTQTAALLLSSEERLDTYLDLCCLVCWLRNGKPLPISVFCVPWCLSGCNRTVGCLRNCSDNFLPSNRGVHRRHLGKEKSRSPIQLGLSCERFRLLSYRFAHPYSSPFESWFCRKRLYASFQLHHDGF